MLRVGLTGSIGSGKSAVSRLLAARGAVVVDADLLARDAVAPGTDGLREVVAAFGADVLAGDGSLDRKAVGALVFGDADARRRLEEIIHPRVRATAAEVEAAAAPDAVVVHDIPLLVETGQAGSFDVVVVVDVSYETAVSRLVETRGMNEQEAWSRLHAQASRTERCAAADVVVDNTGTLAELERRVDTLWEDLSARVS